jgi:integrase
VLVAEGGLEKLLGGEGGVGGLAEDDDRAIVTPPALVRAGLETLRAAIAAAGAALPYSTCCHTFRTGIATYLQNGGTLEHAQQIAAHESPRTTKLYDRAQDEISLDEVERIRI